MLSIKSRYYQKCDILTTKTVFYDINLCRELTAKAHAVPVHCAPGLSKYVIVIVVEDPLVVVIAHGPAQTKH